MVMPNVGQQDDWKLHTAMRGFGQSSKLLDCVVHTEWEGPGATLAVPAQLSWCT